jgi:hypothetical protein
MIKSVGTPIGYRQWFKQEYEKISTSVKDRIIGEPVRFIYDKMIEKTP